MTLKDIFANIQADESALTANTMIRHSIPSALTNNGTCNVILCVQCIANAQKVLNGDDYTGPGQKRTSGRMRNASARARESASAAPPASDSGKNQVSVEDFACPCGGSDCGIIGNWAAAVSSDSFKSYPHISENHSFKTFCCRKALVFLNRRKPSK